MVLAYVVSGTPRQSLPVRARNTRPWSCWGISARGRSSSTLASSSCGEFASPVPRDATFKDVHVALHLLATGAVKPFIGRVLPFAQAAAGHALMERRAVPVAFVLVGW